MPLKLVCIVYYYTVYRIIDTGCHVVLFTYCFYILSSLVQEYQRHHNSNNLFSKPSKGLHGMFVYQTKYSIVFLYQITESCCYKSRNSREEVNKEAKLQTGEAGEEE